MMKKLLIIALILIGVNRAAIAQKTDVKSEKTVNVDSSAVTQEISLESISEKIDEFMEVQQTTNVKLEEKIDRANSRVQSLKNEYSWRWLFRDLIPLLILGVIGVFLVAVVYIIANVKYRNNMLKYDTIVKCVEKTGSAPEFFTKIEQQKSIAATTGGRVHVILSVMCGLASILFLVVCISNNSMLERAFAFVGFIAFIYAAFLLFKQYNNISENSRKEQ